jgi:NADH:ubiquinone oxidoreductase subunit F (NADH-binding)
MTLLDITLGADQPTATLPAGAERGVRGAEATAWSLPGVRLGDRPAGHRPDRLLAPGSLLLAEVTPGRRRHWREHLSRLGPVPSLDLDTLAAAADAAGVLGHGGAGFPTATKLRAMRGERRALVVVNASEGEHASAKDGVLLRHVPHLVLDGAALAARAVGADSLTVRVSDDRPDLPDVVRAAAAEREGDLPVRVSVGPATFVAGESSAVVNALAGRAALPAPLGRPPRLPSRLPTRRRPVLLSNVETFARLALAARGSTASSALLTVSGAVARPGVVELPSSATVADALAVAGGSSEALAGLVTGGWHGRWLRWTEGVASTRLSRHDVAAAGGRWGAGVLAVLPSSVCPLVLVAAVARTLAEGSAGQCGPCRAGLPFVAAELARAATTSVASGPALVEAVDGLDQVRGRGLCAHPTAAAESLSSALAWAGPEVERHRRGRCRAGW